MFLFLEHAKDNSHYHYPLRALAEYFSNQKTARELSKRLNAEHLLGYKQQKDVLGNRILDEFSKNQGFTEAKIAQGRFEAISQGYVPDDVQ